jgi:mRNA interferase RelE/StbE
MAFDFIFTREAEEDLCKLDMVTRRRIAKKLQTLKDYDDLHHVAISLVGEMQGLENIRVGHYRVICKVKEGAVVVLRIGHRRNVYR